MIGLSRLKRAIEDVPTGGMQTGDPKVRLKLCDAQRLEVEFNSIIAERDSALAQNAELVAQVERLNNFSNERIARAATLRSCIEKVLTCEELVFNSDVVLVVSSELADDIRCALDSTPAQHLRDRDAEVVEKYYYMGWEHSLSTKADDGDHYGCGKRLAKEFAEKVRSGL